MKKICLGLFLAFICCCNIVTAKSSNIPVNDNSNQIKLTLATEKPDLFNGLLALEKEIANFSLDKNFIELVKLKVSTINKCNYCINYHTQKLIAQGESNARIKGLIRYNNSSLFNQKEKIGFKFARYLTKNPNSITKSFYQKLAKEFSSTEITELIFIISQMNSWNRIFIAESNRK